MQQVKQDFKENKFSIHLSGVASPIANNAFEIINETANKLVVKINDGFKSNDVLKYFIDQQINIEGFNEIMPSLNDIFISLVEGTKATTRSFQKLEA